MGEVSAYKFNQYLGLDLVPPTVRRKIDGKWQTLQFFVNGNPKFMDDSTTIEDIKSVVSKKDFSDMNIFAFVIGQYDNHKSNMLLDQNNRLTMFDFEVIRIIQHVRYGEFPFVRRGNWTEEKSDLDHRQDFPFDEASVLQDPSLTELKEIFSPYWSDRLIRSFHGYVQHMPQKELNYLRWNGFVWVQNKISSRRIATTDFKDNPLLKSLKKIKLKDLKTIFPKPAFKDRHIELIMQRAKKIQIALSK